MRLPEVGERLGRYLLERCIARQERSAVFLARDTSLARAVALKVLAPPPNEDPVIAHARFDREARLLASLDHPHVAVLYERGTEAGLSFFAMEWIEGETLAAAMKKDLPFERAARALRAVAEALAHLHRVGILQRGLDAADVMLGADGSVKLVDVGAGKAVSEAPLTSATVATMEGSAPATPSSDQRAWGVLANEVLATQGASRTPAWLARIVARAMAPDADARFRSMEALLAAWDTRARPSTKPRVFVVAAGATLVVGLALLAVVVLSDFRRARPADAAVAPADTASSVPGPASDASVSPVASVDVPLDDASVTDASAWRQTRRARKCTCGSERSRLCKTGHARSRCECWSARTEPSEKGCFTAHGFSSDKHPVCQKPWIEGGVEGTSCNAFFLVEPAPDTMDRRLTGKLRCTFCDDPLVAELPSATADEGQPCNGVDPKTGLGDRGVWMCPRF